ncbi:hypothetical protein MC885_021020 [Smutsia gigantea]|nr:hypothetical protein MC885_021020 [Smutsia gigantea]
MVKIDLRTKSHGGVVFSTSGHVYAETGKASSNAETKYKVCNYGLIFTQKWNTDNNTLGTEISLESWLACYQMSLDIAKSKLLQNNFSLGYKVADFQLYTHVNDGTEFVGSIYQKVNEKIETSINLALDGWQ